MQSQTFVHINHIYDECWSVHKLSISSEKACRQLLASRNHDMHVLFLPRGRVTRSGTVCKLPAVILQRLLGSYHRMYAEPVTYSYLSKSIYICTYSPDEAEYVDVLPIRRVSAVSYLCPLPEHQDFHVKSNVLNTKYACNTVSRFFLSFRSGP